MYLNTRSVETIHSTVHSNKSQVLRARKKVLLPTWTTSLVVKRRKMDNNLYAASCPPNRRLPLLCKAPVGKRVIYSILYNPAGSVWYLVLSSGLTISKKTEE